MKNNLPADWQKKTFSECLERESSSNDLKIPQSDFLEEGNFPIIDQGEKFIAGYTDDETKVLKEDRPVIVFGDHTRILKYVDFPFALGADGVKVLVPKKELNPKYFYYFLKFLKIESHGYSRHYKFLKEKDIIVPPFPTQQEIVSILEKSEALKQKREEADKLTNEYLKSVFYEMFGDPVKNEKKWELQKSKDCFKQVYGIPLDSTLFGNNGKALIRIRDLLESKISIYTTEDLTKFKEIPLAKKGDLLIGMDGDFNLVKWSNKDVIINQRIVKIEPISGVEKEYLRFVMPFFVKIIERNKAFVTVKHLSDKDLKQMILPLPHLLLQKKFASIVEQIEKLKEKQKESSKKINEMFAALMQKAFNGELAR